MLRYSEVSSYKRKQITNGCGGKGGWIKPPSFIFKASCNQHDFYYWRGVSEEDRVSADNSFYRFMKEDIADAKWYMKPYYHQWALAYYVAVRLFGKEYFNYSENMRTLADL